MRNTYKLSGILMLAVTFGAAVFAATETFKIPVFHRPDVNAPKVRVDGRVRGANDAVLTLTVLVPEEVGLTTREQPSLFWYQSKAANAGFEFTITQVREATPLLEVKLPAPDKDGIYRFRLAEHGVSLEPNVEYRWTVAMVVDPNNRSKDVVAGGRIKRVSATSALTKRLEAAPNDRAFVYADEGIWYDSLEALSDQIETEPADKGLHRVRGIFFMQVGLPEAANHEFRSAGVSGSTPATNH